MTEVVGNELFVSECNFVVHLFRCTVLFHGKKREQGVIIMRCACISYMQGECLL